MKLSVALRLSRISNLPTVWTNVLAGVALAGGAWSPASITLVLLAVSLFYTGGMFLNDAFDREFDARMRPDRPIPAGHVSAARVFGAGFGMLVLGQAALLVTGMTPWSTGWAAAFAGLLLCAAIVLYDLHHKNNPLSPLVMGVCRMLVYVIAAFAVVATPRIDLYAGALVLLCYLIGLTYAAKEEHLNRLDNAWPLALLAAPAFLGIWLALDHPMVLVPLALLCGWSALAVRRLLRRASGDVPGAVVSLLAGISLVDAVILAGYGHGFQMLLALAAFALTLWLQRWVSGT